MICCFRNRRKRRRAIRIHRREEKVNAKVVNQAKTGNVSGILNIIVQVPIQIGANAQNLIGSDNTSTTVI